MNSDERNRCGVGSLSLPEDHPFTPACAEHDRRYLLYGKDRDQNMRKEIDKQLLQEMLIIANEFKGIKRAFYVGKAYLMYRLVRIFGGKYYD